MRASAKMTTEKRNQSNNNNPRFLILKTPPLPTPVHTPPYKSLSLVKQPPPPPLPPHPHSPSHLRKSALGKVKQHPSGRRPNARVRPETRWVQFGTCFALCSTVSRLHVGTELLLFFTMFLETVVTLWWLWLTVAWELLLSECSRRVQTARKVR